MIPASVSGTLSYLRAEAPPKSPFMCGRLWRLWYARVRKQYCLRITIPAAARSQAKRILPSPGRPPWRWTLFPFPSSTILSSVKKTLSVFPKKCPFLKAHREAPARRNIPAVPAGSLRRTKRTNKTLLLQYMRFLGIILLYQRILMCNLCANRRRKNGD